MKKIIIIDDRGIIAHPGIEKYKFVDFFEIDEIPPHINPDDYIIAIIHQNNAIAASWAKRQYKPVIIISGSIISPSIKREVVNIPRDLYKRHLTAFMDYYARTELIQIPIFFGKYIDNQEGIK